MDWLIISIAIKYAVNGINKIEAWIQQFAPDAEIPNLAKQGLVAACAWGATHIPWLQPYLQVLSNDPNVQAVAVAAATFAVHHVLNGLVWAEQLLEEWLKRTKAQPKPVPSPLPPDHNGGAKVAA